MIVHFFSTKGLKTKVQIKREDEIFKKYRKKTHKKNKLKLLKKTKTSKRLGTEGRSLPVYSI